jgi:NhaP-type Na+/H+ and K+/H+ antiporter
MGMFVLLGISILSAAVWHRFVPKFALATFGATASSVVLFQVGAYIDLGHLDPFFLIAVVTSSIVAAIVAILIGLPIRARRNKEAKNAP